MVEITNAAEVQKSLVEIYHHLHQHPELSDHEFETSALIRSKLKEWGVSLTETQLKTGVIAEINSGQEGPTIALRADIDALPIQETTKLAFASQNAGIMHACGHDIHITALLGAAYVFTQQPLDFKGKIRLIFQPSEEANEGALQVIDAGHAKGVDAILGLHVKPGKPVGNIGIRAGYVAGSIDKFNVTIEGTETHAAHPDQGTDVIVALTDIVGALQTIISRNVEPTSSAVLSVTELHAGTAWNIIPRTATFSGTVRVLGKKERELIRTRFKELVSQLSAAYRVNAKIDWYVGDPAVYNDPDLSEIVKDETGKFTKVFESHAELGSDDFSCYQELLPGVYAHLGVGDTGQVHHSDFAPDENAILTGVSYYVNNTLRLLEELR
ncbi:N-acetyl-L,L-diaminopimelate deacetylase [Liquorilactobacillus sucicola DSM 21376 = JCM 15457]|uniref:Hippurate hydrolase n=1 Tax=Liquorilactobacillus sucicola DSM 21376 = JCM 15457 TaxID=1423806 RepID=A0A023CZZ1_9LACO|nr:amidohydrolase [Liquorilactobacillus sucicola]KRN06794.1 hippurate hydrolase [Liquorilactobacillus sucicola DSM 21376 = JCM 15457]GAJ27075.1 N-acetyl-L,L-diaminopimelate deacetylase [Liquorilactobacillus sucicola DSM 21376 = JCM 15457]